MLKFRKRLTILSYVLVLVMICSTILATPVFAEGIVPNHASIVMTESPQDSVLIAWETNDTSVTEAVVEVVEKNDPQLFESDEVMETTDGSISISGSIAYSKVLVTGLSADTEYIFRCGDGTDEGWSETGCFRTAPDTQEPFTFLYLSDPQINATSASQTENMFDDAYKQFGDDLSFTLITGDFTDSDNLDQWNDLFEMGRFSEIVTVPILGNHDRMFGMNYIKHKFPDPPTDSDDSTKVIDYTYAFEYGAALFMVINMNGNLETIAQWVEEQVNQSDKPWQIVAFHEAMYTAGTHISEQANARKVLSPVFDQLGIDLVLQGHDHVYSRSIVNGDGSKVTPISVDGDPNKVFNPDAPIYYQTVSGACKFYDESSYRVGSEDPLLPNYEFIDFKVDTQADSSSADGNKMCYTGISVSNESLRLTTYYTTTKTNKNDHLETYTIYNTQPAYITKGSEWKYLDTGIEQDTVWKDPVFEDSEWKIGPAPLGYPDDEERPLFGAIKTLIEYGEDEDNRYITTYFRKTFDVSDPSILADKGTITLGIDDGVILYLNGQEIARYNMPEGDVTYDDYAAANEDEPASVEDLPVLTLDGEDLSHLCEGMNVLAAEVHQWNGVSSDLYWDMELTVETKAAQKTLDSVILGADDDTVSIGGPGGGSTVQLLLSGMDDSNQDVNLADATIQYETDRPEVVAISPEGVVSVKNKAVCDVEAQIYAIVTLRGETVTSDPISLNIIITSEQALLEKNSEWSYLDNGSDQGSQWRDKDFDDSEWAKGEAPLGYPAILNSPDFGTVSTKVNEGGSSKYITTYFRKEINIENPDDYGRTGTIIIGVDDGIVLYLNGEEIARYNMPQGTVLYSTTASSALRDVETATITLDNLSFEEGKNVFAAEVHQQSSSSSDLYWDMELLTDAPAEPVELKDVELDIDNKELVVGVPGDRNTAQLSVSAADVNGESIDLSETLLTYHTDRSNLISIDSDGVVTGNYLPSLNPTAKIWAKVKYWNHTVESEPIEVSIQFAKEVLLVSQGEDWLYSDVGDIENDQWMNSDFDDSGWKTGPAPLGYGSFESSDFGIISTEVGYGSSSNSKYTTTYFRKKFSIDNPEDFIGTGTITFGIDDGVVLYLNGEEIARDNMPEGTISYKTEASERLQNYKTVTMQFKELSFEEGENVIAAEVHQNGSNSSDLFWDMSFQAEKAVEPEIIDFATLTANKHTMTYGGINDPENIQLSITGKDILLNDLDLTGASVQYFTNWPDLINIDANGLVTFKKDPLVNTTVQIWANVTLWGKTVMSNMIYINVIKLSQQTLIQGGMEWQYLDDGTPQSEDWKEKGFDETWSSGTAPLGFDEEEPPEPADEWPEFGTIVTTVGYGGDSNNKNPTTYFRKTFTITDTSLIGEAGLIECGLDDGAILYLNGHEIARFNMPEGTVTYETLTPTNADEELEEPIRILLDAGDLYRLVDGENVIAVEVHQCRAASTDLYWDMRLMVDTYYSIDIVPPEISLTGANPLQLKLYENYIEPGATATDDVDGEIDPVSIQIDSSALDTSTPGTYTVTYTVEDQAGNTATATRTVIVEEAPVIDKTPPVITLNGEETVYLAVGDTYDELGATATDNVDEYVEVVYSEDVVDTSTAGTYAITYTATDAANNTATATRTVIVEEAPVIDKTPPVITLNGEETVYLEVGDTYDELGATATDEVDGEIDPASIQIDSSALDTSKPDTYTVTYTVEDQAGNTATATRTVIVSAEPIEDTTPPAITLKGANLMNLTVGDKYEEPGATALDNKDGPVTVTITGNVDTSKAGTYTITYTATDAANNTATATRTVIVEEAPVIDKTPPVITLNGEETVYLAVGDTYDELGATATDNVDEYVEVVYSEDVVDTSIAGTYTITYTATDAANNTATATRTVIVEEAPVIDKTPPVITLNGEETVYLAVGDTYDELGATATDNVDEYVEVVYSEDVVDTSTAGTYAITYTATDVAGNTATATRTVIVSAEPIEDTTPPAITLKGANPMNLNVGDTYTEPGATATDNRDGSVPVTVTGEVDTSKAGTYTITYTATDAAGNEATATRTVKVTKKSSGGSSGGGGGGSAPIIPDEKIPSGAPKGEILLTSSLNNQGVSEATLSLEEINEALDEIKTNSKIKNLTMHFSSTDKAKGYLLYMPAKALKGNGNILFQINTPEVICMVPNNALCNDDINDEAQVGIRVTPIHTAELDRDLHSMAGNRPVIELAMLIDGKPYAWNNPNAPIKVAIEYQPTQEEMENHEHLVVIYIDAEGNIKTIHNGSYDTDGKVTFSVTHLRRYAVGFIFKKFDDIISSWARSKIEVMASKGIIGGTSATTYSPYANITRADFLYLLFRAMGIELQVESNFDDIKPGIYYYHSVGLARILNITSGTGNNRYSPDAFITRQDMMVMVAKTLKVFGILAKSADLNELDQCLDGGDIVPYAREPIALLLGESLVPADPTFRPGTNASREEIADMIYNIYFYMREDHSTQE